MSFFDVYGPFELEKQNGRFPKSQRKFWSNVEETHGLASAIGCYIFCTKFGEKLTPWYVGMTVCAEGFAGEVFQQHKIDIFNDCLGSKKGTPVMFLLPLMTNGSRFSQARKSAKRVILWLEKTLMGLAYSQNDEISNIKDMHHLVNVEVLGLIGPRRPGRRYRESKSLRRALLGEA